MLSTELVGAVSFTLDGVEVALIPFLAFLGVGVFIILPLALLRKWFFYRKRLRKNTITALYEPPLGLNPAEIGYMFDGKMRSREVAATIIHLQQRGYLHIKRDSEGKRIFAGPRVGDDLKTYEKKLIEVADKPEGATLDEMLYRFVSYKLHRKSSSVGTMQFAFTQLVHSDLQRRHYVKMSSHASFFYRALKILILLEMVLIVLPLFLFWTFIAVFQGTTDFSVLGVLMFMAVMFCIIFSVPFYLAACVLTYIRGRIVGREWIITPKLEKLWPQIVGYRQYIKFVENERLEFQSRELQKISKNESLPYAVSLGFVKNWRNLLS